MVLKPKLKAISEILKIDGMIIKDYRIIDNIGYVVVLNSCKSKIVCPDCGKSSDKLHQNHWITVKDLPISEHFVYLKLNRRQMKCKGCAKVFSEEFKWVKKRNKFTERFKHKIISEVLISDIRNVAKLNEISEQEVETIIQKAGAALNQEKSKELKRLGIDKIALVNGQKNYCAVLVDIDKGELITILPKRT